MGVYDSVFSWAMDATNDPFASVHAAASCLSHGEYFDETCESCRNMNTPVSLDSESLRWLDTLASASLSTESMLLGCGNGQPATTPAYFGAHIDNRLLGWEMCDKTFYRQVNSGTSYSETNLSSYSSDTPSLFTGSFAPSVDESYETPQNMLLSQHTDSLQCAWANSTNSYSQDKTIDTRPAARTLPAARQTLRGTKRAMSSSGEDRPSNAYRCPYCSKLFAKEDMFTRHQRQHTKPNKCHMCGFTTAETRDLHRHIWVHHPATAAQMDIPKHIYTCDFPGCNYQGRRDNVARHKKTRHGTGTTHA